MSDFSGRINALIAMVGEGELTGKIIVDQIYAHRQHEDYFVKKHGGQTQYLREPLYGQIDANMRLLAESVLDGHLVPSMIRATESVAGEAIGKTPILPETGGILRRSYHTLVDDNGVTVYEQPPELQRLTEHEITAIHKAVGPAARND